MRSWPTNAVKGNMGLTGPATDTSLCAHSLTSIAIYVPPAMSTATQRPNACEAASMILYSRPPSRERDRGDVTVPASLAEPALGFLALLFELLGLDAVLAPGDLLALVHRDPSPLSLLKVSAPFYR